MTGRVLTGYVAAVLFAAAPCRAESLIQEQQVYLRPADSDEFREFVAIAAPSETRSGTSENACNEDGPPRRAVLSAWNDGLYAEHDWHSFQGLSAAQDVIERREVDYELLSAGIFLAANAQRVAQGKPALRFSRALRDCALGHAHSMAVHGFFAHENPHHPELRTLSQRMAAHGVKDCWMGENIASGSARDTTYAAYSEKIVNQWMNSPGHRSNILTLKYKFMGCAAHPCRCPKFHLIATQNFSSAAPDDNKAPPLSQE